MTVGERYRRIRAALDAACSRAGRDPAEVELLGACKRQPVDRIREAHAAGLRILGENRLQESQTHMAALADLKSFGISAGRGFLPEPDPLCERPSDFASWQDVARELPRLIPRGGFS